MRKVLSQTKIIFRFAILIFFTFNLNACESDDPMTNKLLRESMWLNGKLACFGRYAIHVPKDAVLAWGVASFPSRITVVDAGDASIENYIAEDVSKIKFDNDTAEVLFSGPSVKGLGWQLDYYENKYAKIDGALFSRRYIGLGDKVFFLSAAKSRLETNDKFASRQLKRASNLRLRGPAEVPVSPGYCIEHGFMAADDYNGQEVVEVGLHLPSFPDVKFSISSNKDAYADYPPTEFDERLRKELSLLFRIKQAKEEQGSHYPKRVVLREGIRNVQHWKGEESLIRRADGTHDFEWAFVGRPKDVANPSEFSVQMFTKVAHNLIGAAERASLTDDEAVALWDKLLSGLKFRVKVPGAPEGSYYFLPGEKTDTGAKP